MRVTAASLGAAPSRLRRESACANGSAHGDDGIEQRDEVGPRADGVHRRARLPFLRIEHRGGAGRDVAAGRRAEDADAIRLHAELGGARSDHPHGTEDVLQRRRVSVLDEPVLQHERGDAQRLKHAHRAGGLVGHGQPGIAAAGTHDHRGADAGAVGRRIVSERGRLDVVDAAVLEALDAAVWLRARHALGPQRNHARLRHGSLAPGLLIGPARPQLARARSGGCRRTPPASVVRIPPATAAAIRLLARGTSEVAAIRAVILAARATRWEPGPPA